MKRKIIIILSKSENFLGSAQKIKQGLIKCAIVDILYIEDIYDDYEINSTDIIYFLCNGDLVSKYIKKIKQKNCLIYNCQFLENNYSKLEVQKILQSNNVLIPEIIEHDSSYNVKLPVFCKENQHAGIVFQAFTVSTLKKFFSKFDIADFYLEASINKINSYEIKIYYIKGKVSYKDSININDNKLISICHDISKILGLTIFSADFIYQDNNYYLIDINPAAGFYLSTEARNNLIAEIRNEL